MTGTERFGAEGAGCRAVSLPAVGEGTVPIHAATVGAVPILGYTVEGH